MPLHKSIEKVIVFSRGYIHGLNFPPHLQSYLYIVDWDLIDQSKLGWQRVFKVQSELTLHQYTSGRINPPLGNNVAPRGPSFRLV